MKPSRSADRNNLAQVVNGKTILVTGGTGSLGKALVKSILEDAEPYKVIVLSRDEQKHYNLQNEIGDRRIRCFIGDVRDRHRLNSAFRGVDIIVHAAAMKHVPICEYNPMEAIRTNVDGTRNVIEAAIEANVQRVIAISTDKAVAPANLYGATKLCMEKLFIAANALVGDRVTRFSVCRYGNVMGSAGSVIPLFRKQRDDGRLTITDDRMTRFWINMQDAIELVLRSLQLMRGGEVFIPKLPTTDIVTLAEAMAPGVPRDNVGIRPGEKLHETLISEEEGRRTVDLGQVLMIRPEFDFGGFCVGGLGSSVPEGFSYSSNSEKLRLDVDATRTMLGQMARE